MTCAHSAKKQEVGSDDHADQRGSCRGMEGNQEVCGTIYICISKEETKK